MRLIFHELHLVQTRIGVTVNRCLTLYLFFSFVDVCVCVCVCERYRPQPTTLAHFYFYFRSRRQIIRIKSNITFINSTRIREKCWSKLLFQQGLHHNNTWNWYGYPACCVCVKIQNEIFQIILLENRILYRKDGRTKKKKCIACV